MFIQIVKGDRALMIPAGAFKQYASAGWQKAKEDKAHSDKGKNPEPSAQQPDLNENPKPEADPKQEQPLLSSNSDEGDDTNGNGDGDDENDNVIYVDPEELLEKPIGDLDFEELQIVAEYLGLNIEELTTVKALRKAIKAAQE